MSYINFNNNQQAGFQNALAMGMQMGAQAREAKERKEYRNALREVMMPQGSQAPMGGGPAMGGQGIVATPEQEAESERLARQFGMEGVTVNERAQVNGPSPEAMAILAERNPQLYMQLQERQQTQQRQAQQQRRADLPMALKLLESATDEASYQHNLQVAQQYGIDTSNFPQSFDPVWREQNLATMRALTTPQGQEILSAAGKKAYDEGFRPGDGKFEQRVTELTNAELVKTIPYQPGGNVIAYDTRTQTATPIVKGQAVPPISEPIPFDPSRYEVVEEGSSGNAGGGFPGN